MKNCLLLIYTILLSTSCNWANDFPVIVNGQTNYAIVTPVEATKNEIKAAQVLQHYIQLSTGVTLPITKENAWKNKPAFFIGKTEKAVKFNPSAISGEGFLLASDDKDIVIYGKSGKGALYGVYEFLEVYFEAQKLDDSPGKIKEFKTVELPIRLRHEYNPPMVYRQAYYPFSNDAEYLDWHKLHQFEDLWGIWGHSYFKLINPKQYFKSNPEYFSLINGQRQAIQICPSNEDVLNIAITQLKEKIADNPDAMYWSISAEDELTYCTCKTCNKINAEEGSATGAHLRFVNKIAKQFPAQTFTTLAYTFTSKAPLKTKPEKNVYVMLSTIDAYRNNTLATESSAASFRKDLEAWEKLTHNLFVWDYTTQFTNYLAPFPDIFTLGENIKYFAAHHIKGVFSQGSGDTYSDFAEVKSYLIAKLLWNPELDARELLEAYCKKYYRGAGKFVMEYIALLNNEAKKTNRKIDIYGNPINEYNTYLTPLLIEQYSSLFDQAEGAVEEYEVHFKKIQRLRLSLEYTVLQQARFYGKEKQGYMIQDEETLNYVVIGAYPKRVKKFVDQAKRFGVAELSEGGLNPDDYLKEWNVIFERGWKHNYASEAKVTLHTQPSSDYFAKKERTLIDEVFGEKDFSYNWLCFYDTDFSATIDMETSKEISVISLNFLDDPRHFIFMPTSVEITYSLDGKTYFKAQSELVPTNTFDEEHFDVRIPKYVFKIKPQQVRFIKVMAKNNTQLPAWRFRTNKKPTIACDEVLIF